MKRIAILIAVFALAACVPIQPDDPNAIEPRAKGGLEEFAYVLAKLDVQDDSSEYLDLLLEFEQCIMAEWENMGNNVEEEFSDEELEVLIIHTATVFKTAIMINLYEELDGVEGEDPELDERLEYQGLVWTVASCND